MLPAGTVDVQGQIDSILELQRTHGNRAVVQLIGAADGQSDVGGRADRLAKAVSLSFPFFDIDMAAAIAALDGLSATQIAALRKEFQSRLGMPLGLVIERAHISDAERKQLNTLLQGSAIEQFDDKGARQVGEATGAFVGGLAAGLGFDVDPDVAAKVGGAVLESQARAGYESERPQNERAVATRRRYAEAHEVRALMGKDDKERLFALIGRSHDDRMSLADAYAKEYGSSVYNDLTEKLRGRDLERFQALWAGDKRTAEAVALAADTDVRKKAEDKVAKYGPVMWISDSKQEMVADVEKARAKQEQRVESLASSGELEAVIARAGPELEGVIEKDAILGFLRRGNVPELMATRLVRAQRDDKLTVAMLEEALRSLNEAAEAEAQRSLLDSALAAAAPLLKPLFVAGFYKRFEQEFDWRANGVTLKQVIAKTGDKARRQRNEALRTGGGMLEPWQELDFAIRADPKDMDTVKRVLGELTIDELRDPRETAKDGGAETGDKPRTERTVAEQYHDNTNRYLRDDLKGTIAQQRVKQLIEGGDDVVEGAEIDQWLHGGKFQPKSTDPAERIAEEGRWLSGKLFNYERLVMENRGIFAKGRDWLGNIDKRLVDIAGRDAAIAKNALENALLEQPADLAEASRQLSELRLVERRLDTNLAAYRKGTAEAWDEFVDFVAEVVTAIGTGGESLAMSFLRKAIITAAKTALYTIGTKLVLNGKRYATVSNIVKDLRGAIGSGLGAGLSEKFVGPLAEDLAWSVSAWAAKRGMAPALVGKVTEFVARQEGDVFVGGITTALATGEDLQGVDLWSQARGMGMSHLGSGVHGAGKKAGKKWDKWRKGRKGGAAEEPAPGAARRPGESADAVPGRATAEPADATLDATGIADDTADVAGDSADAETPAVPMSLPEPAANRPRKRGEPPPIPEAAKRLRKPRPAAEQLDPGTGPRSGDEEGPSRAAPDADETARPHGEPLQGPAEAHPPVEWDHQLVIQLGEATNRSEAHALMVSMFGQSPTREVGLYRNAKTGEYIIIQGETNVISLVPAPGKTQQRWKEILAAHSTSGRWELVSHTHPNGRPFPSGAPGDFGQIVREALNRRVARQSEVLFPTTDGGLRKTEFGFDPDHDAPFWIKPDGVDEPYRFTTLDDYNAFVGNNAPVEPWIPRGKVDWKKLPEIFKASKADAGGQGPREGGDDPSDQSVRRDDSRESTAPAPKDTTGTSGSAGPAASAPGPGVHVPGIPPQTLPALAAFAKHYHLVIDVRPPGSQTAHRLLEGAIPKPEAIKAKTVNDADLLLGAPKGSIGLVGYFEPTLPERPRSMGDVDWATVTDRFAQRGKEFTDLAPAMAELVAKKTVQVQGKIVYAVDPRTPGNGPDQFRPVAGDVDIYQIQKANGKPLSAADAERYAALLRSWGIAVEHGAHLRWQPKGEAEQKIFKDVVDQHGPGGEPLIRIEAGDAPKLVDNSTSVNPRPGADYQFDEVARPEPNGPTGQSGRPEDAPLVDKSAATVDNADVGSDARPAARDEQEAANRDLREEPNRPASRSSGAQFDERAKGRYDFLHKVGEGINGGWLVRDKKDGTLHLFKSSAYAKEVDRAQDRGIEKQDYAERSAATELAAKALEVRTPKVELVRIGGLEGSLTEWWPTESLARLSKRDPATYGRIVGSPEFKKAQASIDALDYLVNNLDRNQNLGNYLIQLDSHGNFVSLAPIDHDLTFTSTGMRAKLPDYTRGFPSEYPAALAGKLLQLERTLPQFLESIRPLVGDEALRGVERRLRELLVDMDTKQGIRDRGASKTVGAE